MNGKTVLAGVLVAVVLIMLTVTTACSVAGLYATTTHGGRVASVLEELTRRRHEGGTWCPCCGWECRCCKECPCRKRHRRVGVLGELENEPDAPQGRGALGNKE